MIGLEGCVQFAILLGLFLCTGTQETLKCLIDGVAVDGQSVHDLRRTAISVLLLFVVVEALIEELPSVLEVLGAVLIVYEVLPEIFLDHSLGGGLSDLSGNIC